MSFGTTVSPYGVMYTALGLTRFTSGSVALSGGAATVSTANVTANSRILLTSNVDGGTLGFVRVSARSAGVSFTITSSNGADTSTIAWLMLEP